MKFGKDCIANSFYRREGGGLDASSVQVKQL